MKMYKVFIITLNIVALGNLASGQTNKTFSSSLSFGSLVEYETGFESGLDSFNVEGNVSIVGNSYNGSNSAYLQHYAGNTPHNFYPTNLHAGLGTYSMYARTSGSISDLLIRVLAGDNLDSKQLWFSLRPNGSDNPGISVSGYGIDTTATPNFGVGEWVNIIIHLTPDSVYLNIKGVTLLALDKFVYNGETGRFKLGVAYQGYFDDVSYTEKAYTDPEDNMNELSARSINVDSLYTKRGFSFFSQVSLDTLAASDSLISYQFDLEIPDGVSFDSLRVFHSESVPSVTTNFADGTLSVVTTGSGFISNHDPLLELFFTPDTTGSYLLSPTNVVLNTTSITNIGSGLMTIDPFIKGDVDDSGVVQGYDASIILHKSVGSEILRPDPVNDWEEGPWFNWRIAAADVDEDGAILALDASLISQYVAGVITEFPSSTPEVESVNIVVTNRGLKISSPDDIQSLNIEIPATQQIEFGDPEVSWKDSSVALNKTEGINIAVASAGLVSGDVMEIPLYLYTEDNVALEVITVTNNTRKVHQVVVSSMVVNNEKGFGVPQQYMLSQNYPNPFNPSTQIQYALPEVAQVSLEVFNSVGQKVMVLINGHQSAGYHTATFDASGLSNGLYLYKLTTPTFTQTKKMMLIK